MKINACIIGVQKGGTSSLYNWLSQHPQIEAPNHFKDFPYFSEEKYFGKGFNSLESSYKDSNSIKLMGHVHYIFFKDSLQRLHDYNPKLKLILVLRDPVERLWSSYQYAIQKGLEQDVLRDAIDKENLRLEGTVLEKRELTYFAHSKYLDQIKSLFDVFDRGQVKILLFEDLTENPQEQTKEIFEFLNVTEDFLPNFKHVNKTGKPLSKSLNRFIQKGGGVKSLLKVIPLKYRTQIRKWIISINQTDSVKTKIEPQINESLYTEFSKDNSEIQNLIQKDLSKWHK